MGMASIIICFSLYYDRSSYLRNFSIGVRSKILYEGWHFVTGGLL